MYYSVAVICVRSDRILEAEIGPLCLPLLLLISVYLSLSYYLCPSYALSLYLQVLSVSDGWGAIELFARSRRCHCNARHTYSVHFSFTALRSILVTAIYAQCCSAPCVCRVQGDWDDLLACFAAGDVTPHADELVIRPFRDFPVGAKMRASALRCSCHCWMVCCRV